MTNTAIIGIGMTPVGEHWDRSLRELAVEAAKLAMNDSGLVQVEALYVSNAYASTFNQQSQLGALLADYIGLTGVEAYTVEAGDASGGAALRAAHLAVASGQVQSALVLGVEKPSDVVGGLRTKARAISLDADYEALHGATLPAMAALLMRRYMHAYDLDVSRFEGFSINAHMNGKQNPYAMYRNTLREGAFAKAPMVADPVNLFDSAPDADGAAAVVLVSAEKAADLVPKPVRIIGSAVTTDRFMLQDRGDLLELKAASLSTQRAIKQAKITVGDVDLFELHDSFTILSALSLEAAGYAERGCGWQLANEAQISLTGQLPICTFGGLKSRGNPAGAAGIYQAVEACLQLREEAADNQVAHATIAMIQNLGGLGSTAATHILSRNM